MFNWFFSDILGLTDLFKGLLITSEYALNKKVDIK